MAAEPSNSELLEAVMAAYDIEAACGREDFQRHAQKLIVQKSTLVPSRYVC